MKELIELWDEYQEYCANSTHKVFRRGEWIKYDANSFADFIKWLKYEK